MLLLELLDGGLSPFTENFITGIVKLLTYPHKEEISILQKRGNFYFARTFVYRGINESRLR